MKKILFSLLLLSVVASPLFAQDEEKKEPEEKRGFKKENLFTGGSVSFGLGFSSGGNTFSIGASPVFGCNITHWLDAGVVVNYNYASYSYSYPSDYKIRVNEYGGGVFTKIYPIRFLYLQAQFEHNFSQQKYIPGGGGNSEKLKYDGNSFLVGAGYSTTRDPQNKSPFFYIGIMADVSGNKASPYVGSDGNAVPIISTGIQIPLFQGRSGNNYEEERGSGGKRPRNYNR